MVNNSDSQSCDEIKVSSLNYGLTDERNRMPRGSEKCHKPPPVASEAGRVRSLDLEEKKNDDTAGFQREITLIFMREYLPCEERKGTGHRVN